MALIHCDNVVQQVSTAFAPRPKAIPLRAIERVICFYAAHGIHFVLIPDENFGNLTEHAAAVTDLLARYRQELR